MINVVDRENRSMSSGNILLTFMLEVRGSNVSTAIIKYYLAQPFLVKKQKKMCQKNTAGLVA